MLKEMSIDDKLRYFMESIRAIHNKFPELHMWRRDFRPWVKDKAEQKYIECPCGESRQATAAEYEAAALEYDGY